MIRQSLIALVATISLPAAAATVAFSGSITNDTPPPGPNAACLPGQVFVNFNPGNAIALGTSNFGNFGPSQAHCVTPPPTSYSGGVFEFAFAAGDVLSGSYSGFFTPTGTPNVLNSTVNFVALGGTGRFLGASGTIQGVGILDRSLPRPLSNIDLTGTLNLPAVPEPASWALMIGGFALTGVAMRRRPVRLAA